MNFYDSVMSTNVFFQMWLSGDFPSDWRKAIVIPIPKPGKDPTNPTNYRPIVASVKPWNK